MTSDISEFLVGDTLRATWIDSGTSPSPISAALIADSETLVSSATMTDSGNGHYYVDLTLPGTPGYYVVEYKAELNGNPYVRRRRVRAVTVEV